jgi:hypothetical protein
MLWIAASSCGGKTETAALAPDGGGAPPEPGLYDESIIHNEPTPTEASSAEVLASEGRRRGRIGRCSAAAGSRVVLEPTTLHVRGTILGFSGRVALMQAGHDTPQAVRVGDYLGSQCWRVSRIESESVALELVPEPGDTSRLRTARLYINDGPRPDLAMR